MSQSSNPDHSSDATPADPQQDWRASGLRAYQMALDQLHQAGAKRAMTSCLRIWPRDPADEPTDTAFRERWAATDISSGPSLGRGTPGSGKTFWIAPQDIRPLLDTHED